LKLYLRIDAQVIFATLFSKLIFHYQRSLDTEENFGRRITYYLDINPAQIVTDIRIK